MRSPARDETPPGAWPLRRARVEATLRPLAEARPLPGECFTRPEVFAFEVDEVLGRGWVCVGREDELGAPGSWRRVPLARERLVVVRGEDLALRALHDVCRHRGAPLLDGEAGRARALACPYHGWTYDLAGKLRDAPEALPGLDRGACGLLAARVETWCGFVFATCDAEVEPLATWMGEPPPWFERASLFALRLGRGVEWETRANWKLLVENFQESHHFGRIHPALEGRTPSGLSASWLGPSSGASRWLGGTMELAPDAETVSTTGELRGRPLLVRGDDRRRVQDAMLFPTLLTSLQPDYLLTYRLVPLAPDRTRVLSEVFFHEGAFTKSFDPGDVYAFWDRVNAEDRDICERQQACAGSAGFSPVAYAACEDGVHAFDRMIAHHYIARGEP